MSQAPVLEVRNLVKHFPLGGGLFQREKQFVKAVNGVSFRLERGRTLAIVGESGCGKSTVGRTILGLTPPTAGEVLLGGTRIDQLRGAALRQIRPRLQVVYQDPFSSLNPRMKIGETLAEPLVNFGLATTRAEARRQVAALLERVALPAAVMDRFPHEFSGGQRQRIGIARALASKPEVIICDEAVSALDVSIQAQILNLLCDLQRDLGLSLLFISHDLGVVEHIADEVAVMYLGRIAEQGPGSRIFAAPQHPYTQALLSAAPLPDPQADRSGRIVLRGDVPSPLRLPPGCAFASRCPMAMELCRTTPPPVRPCPEGEVSCHLK